MSNSNNNRRKFMATTLQSVGLTALGGLLWSGYSDEVKASPLVLRPPGALPEEDFLKACIKCGLCAEACENRDSNKNKDGSKRPGTLKMAKGGDHRMIGTPYFQPVNKRELTWLEQASGKYDSDVKLINDGVPCYMCDDIPCVPVCPSGALDMPSLLNKEKELDINKSRMGLAVVHKESCIAFWGIQCDACIELVLFKVKQLPLNIIRMNEQENTHCCSPLFTLMSVRDVDSVNKPVSQKNQPYLCCLLNIQQDEQETTMLKVGMKKTN